MFHCLLAFRRFIRYAVTQEGQVGVRLPVEMLQGELISVEEAAAREQRYESEGRTCTLMTVESGGQQIA